jgi:hypothetical protein
MAYITPNLVKHGNSENGRSSVGHALYNYITALIISHKFNLNFIHQPFTHDTERFEKVLGLCNKFPKIDSIEKPEIINIQRIDFGHVSEIPESELQDKLNKINGIIKKGKSNTVFVMGDSLQFPGNLIKESEFLVKYLSDAYWSVNSKINNFYSKNFINVAIHIRRGDIINDPAHPTYGRWKENKHYLEIAKKIDKLIPNAKFYIFSEGAEEEFKEFTELSNIDLVLNGSDIDAFYNLATADMLVTGQSTFSTILAYINKNQIIYTPCLSFTMFENYSKRFIHYTKIEDGLQDIYNV